MDTWLSTMNQSKPVTLFVQCLIDGIYPEVGEAVIRLFRKLGITVTCPTDQTCCGQPAFNAGYQQEARKVARHFVEVFEDAGVVVCPSGSCVNMVRHHYPALFRNDPLWLGRAQRLAQRTFELTEYLVDVLNIDHVDARYDGIITYHDSCHLLRGIGVGRQPRKLLHMMPGVRFVEMEYPDQCCGFGGAFSVKYPDISSAIVEDKVNRIIRTGADTVVGCDMGCLMNIQGRLHRRGSSIKVMHIAQLLAD